MMLDNTEDNPDANLCNAQLLIEARVDLALEFQPIESISHILADRFSAAGIPVIAIETPIPGSIFFGANNYKAGKMAGQVLANFAVQKWHGKLDRIVLIGCSAIGAAPRARLTGTIDGAREVLGRFEESRIVHLDGQAYRETSRAAMAAALERLPKKERLLISAFNDPTAIGALDALRATGRQNNAAIVGQNGTLQVREEIRKPGSPLIASIAYFPELYGEKVVRLAFAILNGERVPLAVYTDHIVLNRATIDDYYPRASTPV
jgi:ribose transport system substrate-binding protein